MPTLLIEGRRVEVAAGATLLAAVRQAGLTLPTLCDHPAVEAWGGCRLCLCETTRPEWNGWRKVVVACMAAAEDGLEVFVESERVQSARRVVLDLLLARCPDTPLVRELARTHGIERTSYQPNSKPTDCVLCGLCTRVCDRIGVGAIATTGRGVGREVAPPFGKAPPDCIGCLACARICPTRCIPFKDGDAHRSIWDKEFRLVRCARCGHGHMTEEEVALLSRRGLPPRLFELCDACKRATTAATFAKLADGCDVRSAS